jgi:transcriptional regulator of acetoin/glycerol metabolism
MSERATFFDELVERLRHMRLEDMPAVVAAMRRSSIGSSFASRGSTSSTLLEELSKALVSMPIEGSKLDAVEEAVVLHALATCEGNMSAAARLLGVDRKAFTRRLQKARRRLARTRKVGRRT